ncbi:hypothetical protein N4G70_29050 [Streptomyces sp. ASQP_92]|uniref:DUF6907 domain-containing protein n=1 Tax=Streptomyces sp. ASQP_92 TaxID=2979116 RepID=UPI0021C1E7F8|nr:hypothetical protein [Streptomyces sp. ASQP_92]MCT9092889.1 hypothetical protein [Streptomyces sp. ASQP_92]
MSLEQAAQIEQPHFSPAGPAARLSPALIHGQPVWVQCPVWCVADHVAENEGFLEDVAHSGAMVDLVVPGGEPSYRLLVHARLGSDPFGPRPEERGPFVVIDDGSEGHHLSAVEAEEFAVRLVAFAEQVRARARLISGSAA